VEVHGFPAALTSFIGREEAVRDRGCRRRADLTRLALSASLV
jgi:hypothetical protein